MTTLAKLITTGTEISGKMIIFSKDEGEIYRTDDFSFDSLPDILKVSVIYRISTENGYIVFTI